MREDCGMTKIDMTNALRLPAGSVDLAAFDPRATPGLPEGEGKEDGYKRLAELDAELSDLQERLFAAGRSNPASAPRILLVLQGMDTSGKGGVIRKAVGLVDPQGVQITAFKAPTEEERQHDFLWRIRRALPKPGMIGIFDRSQYEDVLVARVEGLVEPEVWQARYEQINAFEQESAESGITIIKCFLHVSKDEQAERLQERLDDPAKHWKYSPGDLITRAHWDQYQVAYRDVLERCNTEVAPWFVVPADRKWYRNWAVAQLLLEHLRSLKLEWPEADFDVTEQKELLKRLS